ncbi:MAG: LysR family transcriptional regulator [Haliea sp.]|jgi:LysR family transcriptional regulator for bpeEF and oprC|nr:LysR family transcriptional regulator [Haliea sp.]
MEFQDLRLFVSVVDKGGFTRAAEQEDLPTSTLSLQILEEVDSTRSALKQKQDKPSRRLRVYAPTGFTRVHFQEIITTFAESYPEITLELFTTDGGHNVVDTRVDVMIHIEESQDSSYIYAPAGPA